MNNMGFFNPFGSSGSGGGGGGESTANYSVKTVTDSSGQVSYKLTKNGTAVGDVISFNGSNMLVNYGGELIVLNSAIAGIEEALDKTYNFTTFTELGINTQNKTLSQLSAELAAKNLEEGTVVTGRVYSEALPYNNYGNAEVLVNNSILWWKTSSSTISPYSWNAIVVGNTVKMDWTPTYYQLPIASVQSLGGVKIGDNVQITPDGTISVITTKGDTGTGIASIAKTSSSGLNDIYTITYTDSTTSTFTVTNGATITGGSIGQTGHLILTMSDGRTIDAGALPTDNEVEVTTISSQPADPNVELWVDLSTQQTLSIPEINDSSTSSTQDTWSCKKIYDDQQRQEEEIGVVANAGAKNLLSVNDGSGTNVQILSQSGIIKSGNYVMTFKASDFSGNYALNFYDANGVLISKGSLNGAITADKSVSFTLGQDAYSVKFFIIGTATISELMLRPASITDDTFVPYGKTNAELTKYDAEQDAEIAWNVNHGVKNLFKNTAVTTTNNSVTFTVNSDGTVSLSGTASGAVAVLKIGTVTLKAGTYIVSGCPAGGSWAPNTNKYRIRIAKNDSWLADETGNGYTVSVNGSDEISLQVNSAIGLDATGLVFKPMIRPAAITDSTFQPYSLPNPTLTPAAIKAVDEGAKNLLNLNTGFTKYTNKGITYEDNSDGTIKVSGTSSSADSYITLYDRNTDNLFGIQKGETVVIRSTSDNVSINLVYKRSGGGYGLTVYGYKSSPGWFTVPSDFAGFLLRIGVPMNGTTVNDDVGGMICTAADYAVSPKFVPYAPTNRELYETCETKVTMQQAYGDAIPIPAGSNLNDYNTPGLYYTIVADVSTITNTPYTATGLRLVVEKNTLSGATVFQTIYPTSRAHLEFYRRVYEGGSWSSWYKFEGTAVT